MLSRDSLNAELTNRSEEFRDFIGEHLSSANAFLGALAAIGLAAPDDVASRLNASENPGALPSGELYKNGAVVIPFPACWSDHEDARRWAAEILDNRTTFAADGSQIYTGKETSLPVAAVQIGWFENPHDPAAQYHKNTRFELLTPDILLKDQQDPMDPDIRVEARRYLGEVERIGEFLTSKQDWQERGERMPVAFFDNPLLVPFSQKGLQKSFLDATVELVNISKKARVPLVGYVDRSFSRDILTMLSAFSGTGNARGTALFDASLLRIRKTDGRRQLDRWGDRTIFFYSRRIGLEAFRDADSGSSTVGFTYLQTTSDSPPARLDVPSWVFEEGFLDETVDAVRAECVVGLGYPYILESADQAAVISASDRDAFFRALQEFATREKLDFSVSRKDESKRRRR